MSGRAVGKVRDAGHRSGLDACAGKMRSKSLCWQNADQTCAGKMLIKIVVAKC